MQNHTSPPYAAPTPPAAPYDDAMRRLHGNWDELTPEVRLRLAIQALAEHMSMLSAARREIGELRVEVARGREQAGDASVRAHASQQAAVQIAVSRTQYEMGLQSARLFNEREAAVAQLGLVREQRASVQRALDEHHARAQAEITRLSAENLQLRAELRSSHAAVRVGIRAMQRAGMREQALLPLPRGARGPSPDV